MDTPEKQLSPTELQAIAQRDDLHIAPLRADGVTYGTPTWIWSVLVDGALYVRAYHEPRSSWYQAALRQKAGRIQAAGMIKEVAFRPAEESLNEQIDEAYRVKYKNNPYLNSMISAQARSATIKILPGERIA